MEFMMPGPAGWKPTPEQLKQIEMSAGYGLTNAQIASLMPIGTTTFQKAIRTQPDVEEALNRGKAKVINAISQTLVERALAGVPAAMIFYLKAVAGWREKDAETTVNVQAPDFRFVELKPEAVKPVTSPTDDTDVEHGARISH